jgi:hypothetical protein
MLHLAVDHCSGERRPEADRIDLHDAVYSILVCAGAAMYTALRYRVRTYIREM